MKELFNFIRNAEYKQIDWWIKYTQNQIRSDFSDKEDVSESIIITSVFNYNRYQQFLLMTIIPLISVLSLYIFIRISCILYRLIYIEEVFETFAINYPYLFNKLIITFFLSFIFVYVSLKRWPIISNFKEVNKRVKKLKDEKLLRLLSKQQIIESINNKSLDIENKRDQEILLIKANLKKYDGFIIKNEEVLIKLLLIAKRNTSKDLIMRLCAVAQNIAKAVVFNVERQDDRLKIWLNLINNYSSVYGDSMIDNPYYLNERNPNRLKQNLDFLIYNLIEADLSDLAKEIKNNLENAININRTKKNR